MHDLKISLTNECNVNCSHCFNKNRNIPLDVNMNIDKFIKFMEYNKEYLRSDELCIKILGGEPTLHNDFYDFIEVCKVYSDDVVLFSNGLNVNSLDANKIKKNISVITINGYIFDLSLIKYLKNISEIYFSFTIPYEKEQLKTNLIKIKKLVQEGFYNFNLSPDVSIDIFNNEIKNQYRKTLVDTFLFIKDLNNSLEIGLDHSLPLCFFDGEYNEVINNELRGYVDIESLYGCNRKRDCYGFIGPDFNISVCPNFDEKIINAFDENNNPVEMEKINQKKVKIINDSINKISRFEYCKDCKVKSLCQLGCYYNLVQKSYTSKRNNNE